MEPDLNVDNIMKPVRAVPSTTILKSISWWKWYVWRRCFWWSSSFHVFVILQDKILDQANSNSCITREENVCLSLEKLLCNNAGTP
jgi:hypothetical protein